MSVSSPAPGAQRRGHAPEARIDASSSITSSLRIIRPPVPSLQETNAGMPSLTSLHVVRSSKYHNHSYHSPPGAISRIPFRADPADRGGEPARRWCRPPGCLAAGSGDECGDDVGGVPVEGTSGPVVAHRGPGISVRRCLLDVTQGNAGIQCGGDERVPQRMW